MLNCHSTSRRLGAILFASCVLCCALPAQSTQTVYEYSLPNGYDYAGNIPAMNDTVTGSWTFGYDALSRLTGGSVSAGSYAGISFAATYDTFGNRLTQSVSTGNSSATGVPSTSYTTPDVNNRLSASTFTQIAGSYDASGNMTENDNLVIRYDGEGRVCAVSNKAGGITHYGYDAEGRRVTKSTGGDLSCSGAGAGGTLTSQFLLGPSGEQVTELDGGGNWQHTNVFANGALLATYDAAGLHFAQTDPLGTVRARVKALDPSSGTSGSIEQFCQSFPFGDGQYCAAPDVSEQHFTGKERDTESGLDYFVARYYSSNMGRFSSPDPSGLSYANPTDPQSLNLYSYVENNPLVNIDPDGQACIYIDPDSSSFQGATNGDCDNSTTASANAGIYIDGNLSILNVQTTTGNASGQVTGWTGTGTDDSGTLASFTGSTGISSAANGDMFSMSQGDRISALVDGVASHTNAIINSLPLPCAVGGAFYFGNGRLGGGQSLDTQAGRQNASGFNFISAGGFKVNYTVSGGAAGNLSYVIPTPFKAYGVPLGVEVGTNNGDALHSIQSIALVTNGPGLRNFSAYVNLSSVGSGCHS